MTDETARTAVITMMRRREFPAAWSGLKTIEPQLGRDTVHFLLLNDDRDPDLEAALASRPNTQVITPGRNLGVAVGRNTLIAAALEWGASTIFSLDDDLLVPSDYLRRIKSWITDRQRAGERVGIVAPAVLDFHAVAEQSFSAEEIDRAEQGLLDEFLDTDSLRELLRSAWPEDIPLDAMYHAGIRNWRHHYLENYRLRPTQVRSLFRSSRGIPDTEPGVTELRLDPVTRRSILEGSDEGLPIDTAAGGASVYTAELLREIGGIDEAFSPFGYEDSDFAIRSVQSGFTNYSLPSEILLHDLDSRQKTRSPAVVLHSQGRARGLIGRKHLPHGDRLLALAETAALAPLQAVDLVRATAGTFPSPIGGAIGAAATYLAGFTEGLFAAPSEPVYGNGSQDARYLEIPHEMKRRFTTTYGTWTGSPTSGLPTSFLVDIDVAWSWDPGSGTMRLTHAIADAPGQFRIKVAGELLGVGKRDEAGNADPFSIQVREASVTVEDWGFLSSAQETAAWFRDERTPGYVKRLLRRPRSELARMAQWFLSQSDRPARLDFSIAPERPVSVAELFEAPPNLHLDRKLHLRAMVSEIAYY
ncbi:MAG: galactosyltransferase-related protein [Acidimicrobiia bacterium]|nr:galactosyltransferase-related protein [Acidimicrobiia bacterium]